MPLDERRMTIGEHLEELRGHVVRAVAYVLGAFVICLFFQDPLVRLVTAPHTQAMEEIERERAAAGGGGRAHADTLIAAAAELVAALRAAEDPALASAGDAERIAVAERVTRAWERLMRAAPSPAAASDQRLRFANYSEAFFAYLKIAFICALFAASPLVAVELWRFVAAGLYDEERRWVKIFGPLSYLCFAAGCAFGYFLLIPQTLEYLASYASPDIFAAAVTIDGYLQLFLGLTAALGLVFEVPLVIVFLAILGIATVPFLREYRRYWIFASTIIAAVITPTGDPWTLAIVAIPLCLLYEVGILLVAIMERSSS